MSKNLFNSNTFGNKNVENDNNITLNKVTTDKISANEITTTDISVSGTITNTQFQTNTANISTNTANIATNTANISTNTANISTNTANISTNTANISTNTSNISTNATAITGKQNAFNVDGIVLTLNTGVTPNVLAVTTANDVTQASNALVLGGGIYTYLLNNYNKKLTNGSPLQLQINSTGTGININDELRCILASSASSSDFGLITGEKLFDELQTKEDAFTLGEGLALNATGTLNNELSFDGSALSSNIVSSGDITASNLNYLDGGVVNNVKTKIDANTANIATNTANISTNATNISGKQPTITSGSVPPNLIFQAGSNLTFDTSTTPTTLNAADTTNTYTAASNGGLAVNSSNEFSIDLSNLNSTQSFPQRVEIVNDTTAQLIVKPSSNTGNDGAITIRGARNASTTAFPCQLRFENYDNDTGQNNDLFELSGQVTNHTSGVGGLVISNFADATTKTGNTTMNQNGRWYFGGGGSFQDTYGVRVGGTAFFDEDVTFADNVSFAGTITSTITGNLDIDAKITTDQVLVDTAQSISTNGSQDTALNVSKGLLLMDSETGFGVTNGNGVIQINCRNSGKLSEGICMRASSNNNNCINFRNTNNSARGRIDGNGSSNVVYRTSSDARLKENVDDMDSCWDLVKNARPRKFRWIEDQRDDVGFIAQEVYSLDGFDTLKPKEGKYECCDNSLNTFDEDGYCENPMESEGVIYPHALDYGLFTPFLWKALQEAITKIETLETKVADLEAQLIV